MNRRTFTFALCSTPLLPAAPVFSQVLSFNHPGWRNLDSAAQVWKTSAVGMSVADDSFFRGPLAVPAEAARLCWAPFDTLRID